MILPESNLRYYFIIASFFTRSGVFTHLYYLSNVGREWRFFQAAKYKGRRFARINSDGNDCIWKRMLPDGNGFSLMNLIKSYKNNKITVYKTVA